jgi:deoxycytidylate deaminase
MGALEPPNAADPQLQSLLDDLQPELVLGIVAPVGAEIARLESNLHEILADFGYTLRSIHVSHLLRGIGGLATKLIETPEEERIRTYMDAGNEVRRSSGRNDVMALLTLAEVTRLRSGPDLGRRTVYLLHSFKHPSEVHLLRQCYGSAFFLIGGFASESSRQRNLIEQHGMSGSTALSLISRDEEEAEASGQHLRRAFELADVFLSVSGPDARPALERFVDLLFGRPTVTPTREEMAMLFAYSASLRSGSLSRQVGASILSSSGDVVAIGANDVPRAGGGLYWPGPDDARDHVRGFDSNRAELDRITEQIVGQLLSKGCIQATQAGLARQCIASTNLNAVTEYGRAVHAEMDALLACARTGVSVVNGQMIVTTFPCHNCAKHMIAAGLTTVIFVEPYPKSRALELHGDAIADAETCESTDRKVMFRHFTGVGPRRFVDLFSMTLSDAYPLRREVDGKTISWTRAGSTPRVPLLRSDYRIHQYLEKLLTDGLARWMTKEEATHGD